MKKGFEFTLMVAGLWIIISFILGVFVSFFQSINSYLLNQEKFYLKISAMNTEQYSDKINDNLRY